MQTYHNPATEHLPASTFITLDRDEQFNLNHLRVETLTLSEDAQTYRVSGHNWVDGSFAERDFDYPVGSLIVPSEVRAAAQQASIDQMKAQLAGPIETPTATKETAAEAIPNHNTDQPDPVIHTEAPDWIKDQDINEPDDYIDPRPVEELAAARAQDWDLADYLKTHPEPDSPAQIVADIRGGVPDAGGWNNTRVPTAAEQRMLDAHAQQQAAPVAPDSDPTNWGWKGATETPPMKDLPEPNPAYTGEMRMASNAEVASWKGSTPSESSAGLDGTDFLAGLPREVPTVNQSNQVQQAIKDVGGSAMDRANATWSAAMDRSTQLAGQAPALGGLSQAGMGAAASALPQARIAQMVNPERAAAMLRHPSQHRRT